MTVRRLVSIGLLLLVAGYWALGKSFAYVGLYPFFIGEVSLVVFSMLAAWVWGARRGYPIARRGFGFMIAALSLGLIQASFDMLENGLFVEAVRNLAVVYYPLFGLVGFAVGRALTAEELVRLTSPRVRYIFASTIIVGNVFLFIGTMLFGEKSPTFPGTEVHLLSFKATDSSVAMLFALALLPTSRKSRLSMVVATTLLAALSARSRATLVGFLGWLAIAFARALPARRPVILTLAVLAGALLGGLSIDTAYREISSQQFASNFRSLVTPGGPTFDATVSANTLWRLSWWGQIAKDAFSIDRIASGSGWATNLAQMYGYGTGGENVINQLRNPHNVVIGLLARGGWLVVVFWTIGISRVLFHIVQLSKQCTPTAVFSRAIVTAIPAIVVCSLTDVYMESPQNAIPIWSLLGFAIGVHENNRNVHQVANSYLRAHATSDRGSTWRL